jgi:hypothetical protein
MATFRFKPSHLLATLPLASSLLVAPAHAYKVYETCSTPAAAARCAEAGVEPEPVRWWRRELIFTLAKVEPGEFALSEMKGLVESAMGAWTGPACAGTESTTGFVPPITYGGESDATKSTIPVSTTADPDNVFVFIRSTSEWQRLGNQGTWIAITKFYHDELTGEIVDADMEINDGTFKFSIDGSPEANEVDFLSMLTHEAGHFYGMDHSDDATATMYATYSQGASATETRTLAQDDVEGICSLYTDAPLHRDPTTGGGNSKGGCSGGGLEGLGFGLVALLGLRSARRRTA